MPQYLLESHEQSIASNLEATILQSRLRGTIFLHKGEYPCLIRQMADFDSVKIETDDYFLVLRMRSSEKDPPEWSDCLKDIMEVVAQKSYEDKTSDKTKIESFLKSLDGKSNGVVIEIFLKDLNKRFSITFGHTFKSIDASMAEGNFGFKVVANLIKSGKIRELNYLSLNDGKIKHRTVTSGEMSVTKSRYNVLSDLVTRIGGYIGDGKRMISGSDHISTFLPSKIDEICQFLRMTIEVSSFTLYKTQFEWIDFIKTVTNNNDLDSARTNLVNDFISGLSDFEWDLPSDLLEEGGDIHDEPILSFGTYSQPCKIFLQSVHRDTKILAELKRKASEPNKLINELIIVYQGTRRNICEYLTGSTRVFGRRLYLLDGRWYEYSNEFQTIINERFRQISEDNRPASETFPDRRNSEQERDYNKNLARIKHGIVFDGGIDSWRLLKDYNGQSIELCDVLIGKRKIHVKPWTCGVTISHFFNQGAHSACLFFQSTEFRKSALEKYKAIKTHDKLLSDQWYLDDFNPADVVVPGHWEVIFLILKESERSPKNGKLPLFCQLSFIRAYDTLTGLGFKVRLELVENDGIDEADTIRDQAS